MSWPACWQYWPARRWPLVRNRPSRRFALAAARVWREGAGDEACAQAETLALALVRAWLAFMLAQAPGEPGQPAGSSHKSA